MAETPDTNAHATEDASPFRRFPWVQLAFCIACLTMTAWTWMRYSYAWDVTPEQLHGKKATGHYCKIAVEVSPFTTFEGLEAYVFPLDGPWDGGTWDSRKRAAYFVLHDNKLWSVLGGGHHKELELCVMTHSSVATDALNTFTGRTWTAQLTCRGSGWSGKAVVLDTTVSRFHPASIAGIVVGLMGCFVFGLYLRRWVRERKAALTTEHTEVTENGTL